MHARYDLFPDICMLLPQSLFRQRSFTPFLESRVLADLICTTALGLTAKGLRVCIVKHQAVQGRLQFYLSCLVARFPMHGTSKAWVQKLTAQQILCS